jgi:hypothetical protein
MLLNRAGEPALIDRIARPIMNILARMLLLADSCPRRIDGQGVHILPSTTSPQ